MSWMLLSTSPWIACPLRPRFNAACPSSQACPIKILFGRPQFAVHPAGDRRQQHWIQIVAFRAAQRARAFAIDWLHDHLERIAALAPDGGGGWKDLAHRRIVRLYADHRPFHFA